MLSVAALSSVANTVELSTGDLRQGSAFDAIKAKVSQTLNVGDLPSSKLDLEYNSQANRDFFETATLSGALFEPSEGAPAKGRKKAVAASDFGLTYEVSHNFVDKNTGVKLSAQAKALGYPVNAEIDGQDGITEVGTELDLDAGDESVNVQPSWLVKAQTARVKLMSKLGGGDKLTAQVDYKPDGGDTAYELTLDHNIDDGRDVSATFGSDSNAVEVEYTDSKSEAGATWTASASVPTEATNIVDAAKISLKRSWQW